jgi:tetratricopeptide (TPR) repeat protein
MPYSVRKVESSRPWEKILPANLQKLFLNTAVLYLAMMAWTPKAQAQDSSFERSSGEISGVVLLEAKNFPANQVIVTVKSKDAGISRSVLTDVEGQFELKELPAGSYGVSVEESGYDPAWTSVQVNGDSVKVVLRLKPSKFSQGAGNNFMVSVKELKIPSKARDEYKKGLERLAKNDIAGSLSHLAKATEVAPDYYEAYYHLGVVEAKLGHGDEAMRAFHRAIELTGGHYAWAEFGVGFLLCQEGKPEEAEAIIRKGLELDESSPEGHVVLGMALLKLNRPEEAEKNAREALLRKPNFAEAYLVLSDAYALRQDYRAQLEGLDTYLRLDPRGPDSERVARAREATLKNIAQAEHEQ